MSNKNTSENSDEIILNTCKKMIKDIEDLKKVHRRFKKIHR